MSEIASVPMSDLIPVLDATKLAELAELADAAVDSDSTFSKYMGRGSLNHVDLKASDEDVGDLEEAAEETIHPQSMTWLIVGDLEEIEQPIRDMNLGEVKIITAN